MKFSSLLIFLPLMFACFLAKSQTHVQFSFANGQFNISQYTNVQIILQPEQFNVSGTVTLLQPRIYRTTDTNASVTFSNLFGSYTGGYYRWTLPAFTSADGFNPPVASQGDIQVVSTNLGLISSTLIGVVFVPTYNGSGAAWTAQASDWRYTASTNQLGSYVKIGDFNSATNSIVSLIPSTNGFVTAAVISGLTPLTYLTNYSYPISNPSNFVTSTITNGFSTTGYVNSAVANLATTNSVVAATNGLASTNYVNGQGFLVSFATNQLATTNQLNNYTLTTAFTSGTNSVAANAAANLIATNSLLVALINSSTNGLNFAIGSSNSILISKQPASLTLSNLSATGAFTNALSSGQNFSLTTNFSGNTVILNATNQSFLTNGITGTAYQPLGYYLPTNSLPSLTNGFVQSSITNGLASQQYVKDTISTSGLNTNIYLAGQNVTLTIGGNSQSINATNQTFLTNGLAGTNFVLSSIVASNASLASLTALAATNTASLTITTNLVQNSTNGLASTSYVATAVSTGTNGLWAGSLNYFYPTSNPSLFVTQGQLNGTNSYSLNIATNLAIASTNAGNIVFTNSPLLVQNNTAFQLKTNGFAQGFFGLGTKTNFLLTTNVISLIGGAYGNGTYLGLPFSVSWTNVFNSTNTVLLSGGNYYIQSNGVSLYQSTNILNWTLVNGISPAPSGAWGSKWHMSGATLDGWVYSTNLTWQIFTAISNSVVGQTITNLAGPALTQVANLAAAIPESITTNIFSHYQAIVSGDSLSSGYLGITNYMIFYTNNFGSFSNVINTAVAGQTASNILVNFTTQIGQYLTSGSNILMDWSGINDIDQGMSADTIFATRTNIWNLAYQSNALVCAFTVTSSRGFSDAQELQRHRLNQMIRNSANKWDYLNDVAAYVPTANHLWAYVDLTHFTNSVQRDIAENLAAVLKRTPHQQGTKIADPISDVSLIYPGTITASAFSGSFQDTNIIGTINVDPVTYSVGLGTYGQADAKLFIQGGDLVVNKLGVGIIRGDNINIGAGGALKISTSLISTNEYIQLGQAASGTGVFIPVLTVMADGSGKVSSTGTVTASGFASTSSNTLALASISFPATTVNWTNTFGKNIFVFIDNAGVTGTALKINGTQISSTLVVTGDTMIPLQPGEYFSETYTIGTPAAVWKPQ